MAINTLAYAEIFQQQLDAQMAAKATTGWMEANAGQVIYNGGNTVKIPKISLVGLGAYSRDNGFPQGSVTLEYETKTMTMDRGRTFQLDAMDVNETNFVTSAGTVMGEFQRLMVVPEVDAYRYSSIYKAASGASQVRAGYAPAADTILEALEEDIAKVEDVCGENMPLVITMSIPCRAILNQAKDINRYIDVANFTAGSVTTQVKRFNGIPILSAPSGVMKSDYTFDAGAATTAGGFSAAEGALQINWIIMLQNAPIAVSKTEKVRIFAPDTNQKADAWKLDYRKYHDLWIPDNKLPGIYVCAQAASE